MRVSRVSCGWHYGRENAMDEYGSIKAHGSAIFFAGRDWPESENEESLKNAGLKP